MSDAHCVAEFAKIPPGAAIGILANAATTEAIQR
jgi:hypothetical protein